MKDFEASLARLNEIVAALGTAELPLEQSLALFAEGVKLTEACHRALTEADQTVKVLTKREGEEYSEQDFTEIK